MHIFLAMLLCLSSLWLGCSGEGPDVSGSSSSSTSGTGTGSAGGSGGSGGMGGTGGAGGCGPTQELCGETCANTMVDPANCGGCGVACAVGALCSAGACAYDPITYVKASNTGKGDNFGTTIAISADGNTVAVGAYAEDSNATGIDGNQADDSAGGAGAVYVFTRSGTVWSQQAYIKASNTDAGDFFGHGVSLSGDGNTLAVSAIAETSNATGINGNQADNSASYAGAVYIY